MQLKFFEEFALDTMGRVLDKPACFIIILLFCDFLSLSILKTNM